MNTQIFQEVVQASISGSMTFPQIVGKLISNDVESYHLDLARNELRYYFPNGESHVEPLPLPHSSAQIDFSAEQVAAAVKASQMGQIKFPEFVERILAAGCTYYIAYLSGKKVAYLGRKGEVHTEYFPGSR